MIVLRIFDAIDTIGVDSKSIHTMWEFKLLLYKWITAFQSWAGMSITKFLLIHLFILLWIWVLINYKRIERKVKNAEKFISED